MKKYDLIILGLPKTGTTSLFAMLGDHPEICPSKIKEPINIRAPVVTPHLYFKEYFLDVNKNTKALLDGTPSLFTIQRKREKLMQILKQEWVANLRIVYGIRNPIKRLISYLNNLKRTAYKHPNGTTWCHEWFNDDETVREKEVLQKLSTNFLDSFRINQGKDFTKHIHITKLNDLDVSSILNFLELKNTHLKFNHLNKNNYIKKLKNLNLNINAFLHKNRKYLKTLFTDDMKKIQHDYRIDLTSIINDIQEENYNDV